MKILAYFPELVEHYYSNELYVSISNISRTVIGKIPFSIGDIIYGILIISLLILIWNSRKTWKLNWKDNLLIITSVLAIVYFLFHILWGLNYYRVPLFEKMAIKREYTNQELFVFTEKLIAKTNQIQLKITHNANQKVVNPYTQEAIFVKTQNGYNHLANQYPFFKYQIASQKKSLFSLPLTYMGFGGYLNPFTNEAQVNDMLPMYGFPNVICHEMAHQIGFGSESECNFIGFLAGIKNEDLYFQYAAYSNALRYSLHNIEVLDESKLTTFLAKINPGIIKNYDESEQFWKQYDSFIDVGFHAFYDQFLKFNQQKDGMDSYSKFIDLLVNYYKDKSLN